MPSTVQVTSMKTGPASSISKTFANVQRLTYDFPNRIIKVESLDGTAECDIDIDAATTITHTISSKQHTVAIS